MTTATATFPPSGARRARALPRMALAFAASLCRGLRRRRTQRLAIGQLHAMSDRQLLDLGIHRGQIEALVRGRGGR